MAFDKLKYIRESWPIEQMYHKSRRSDEGSNGEYFPRTVDRAVMCVINERWFQDGFPVYENTTPWIDPNTGIEYQPGELIITKYLSDGTENPLYNDLTIPRQICMVEANTDLNEALNGLEQRMLYMETSGVGMDSVGKEQLKAGAVDTRALDNGAVTTEKIKDGTILMQDLDHATVDAIVKHGTEGDTSTPSKTIAYDEDNKVLEVKEGGIDSSIYFTDDTFDKHYIAGSTNAAQSQLIQQTIGEVVCDPSQEGTSFDTHGLKLTDGDAVVKSDNWMVGKDADITDTTSISAVVNHIINTDLVEIPTDTTSQPVFIDEEGHEVTLQELLDSSTELKEAVKNDVRESIGTEITDRTYSKADIDAKIAQAGKVKDVTVDGTSVVNASGIAAINLNAKADKATTYTKDETDSKINEEVKLIGVKVPNGLDPTQGETLTIVDKMVTIPTASGSQFGVVKYGTWGQLKAGEAPNPTDIVAKVNAKADASTVYNKADSDARYMPLTQEFKSIDGVSIKGAGNISTANFVRLRDEPEQTIEGEVRIEGDTQLAGDNTIVFGDLELHGGVYEKNYPHELQYDFITRFKDCEHQLDGLPEYTNEMYDLGTFPRWIDGHTDYDEYSFIKQIADNELEPGTIVIGHTSDDGDEWDWFGLVMRNDDTTTDILWQYDETSTPIYSSYNKIGDKIANQLFMISHAMWAKIEASYSKPSTGIPEADLSQEVRVKLNSGGSATPVVDALDSTSTTSALSANQGRILNTKIIADEARISAVETSKQDKLTTEQLAVLNSGITADLVAKLKEFLEGDARVIKRMTQAEYDAMPADKKAYTLAIIKD